MSFKPECNYSAVSPVTTHFWVASWDYQLAKINLDHTNILRWTLKITVNLYIKMINDFRLSNIYDERFVKVTINAACELEIC